MSDQGVDGGDAPFASAQNLKLLESVEVKLIVEVGGTKISIRDLLKLSEGSVVELERLAGELLDISVNGTLIARGEIVLVGERDLERAVSLLLGIEKTVVEGAGAAGLAALLAHPRRFKGAKVGLVLCGGNIDTRLLANVLLRDLARSGRLARLRIRLKDRPGQLFEVARIFDQQQVNILEVYHQRVFTNLPAKGLITDIECETRDRDHLDRLVEALRAAGYETRMVEAD